MRLRAFIVANASHELRTPLAISRTAVDRLAGKLEPTRDQVAAAVEKERASTARSEHLIDRLLVLARSESGPSTVEDVDLAEVADEAVEDLSARAADREVDMRLRLAPARTKDDRVLFGHLVASLVENGIKYTGPAAGCSSPRARTPTARTSRSRTAATRWTWRPYRRCSSRSAGSRPTGPGRRRTPDSACQSCHPSPLHTRGRCTPPPVPTVVWSSRPCSPPDRRRPTKRREAPLIHGPAYNRGHAPRPPAGAIGR